MVDVVEGSLTYIERNYQYQAQVTDDDPDNAYRLVGFSEYTQSLRNFDELIAKCDPEELTAIDEIVRDSDAYVVYANLSRPLERTFSSLSEPMAAELDAAKTHGFAWVVALARMELAAMLAGFTETPNPFVAVRPSLYEIGPYRQMVRDGLRTHYWALVNDAELASILRNKSDDGRLLAYHRRMKLARKLLAGVSQLEGQHLTAEQQVELVNWSQQMESLGNQIVANVQHRLRAMSGSSGDAAFSQESSSATFRGRRRFSDK